MMASFNLSEWAVNNRAIVVFLMLVCVIGGIKRLPEPWPPGRPGLLDPDHGGPGILARAPPQPIPSSR